VVKVVFVTVANQRGPFLVSLLSFLFCRFSSLVSLFSSFGSPEPPSPLRPQLAAEAAALDAALGAVLAAYRGAEVASLFAALDCFPSSAFPAVKHYSSVLSQSSIINHRQSRIVKCFSLSLR